MSKPIFEPGDFMPRDGLPQVDICHVEIAAEIANAKLLALGIDAETPEKLRQATERLRWVVDTCEPEPNPQADAIRAKCVETLRAIKDEWMESIDVQLRK